MSPFLCVLENLVADRQNENESADNESDLSSEHPDLGSDVDEDEAEVLKNKCLFGDAFSDDETEEIEERDKHIEKENDSD